MYSSIRGSELKNLNCVLELLYFTIAKHILIMLMLTHYFCTRALCFLQDEWPSERFVVTPHAFALLAGDCKYELVDGAVLGEGWSGRTYKVHNRGSEF